MISIGDSCVKIVRILTERFLLERLSADDLDFNEEVDYVIHDQARYLIREIQKLQTTIDPTTIDSEINLNQSVDEFVEDYRDIPRTDVNIIFKNYNKILKDLANTDCSNSIVNKCATLLWRWYEARIIRKYNHVPTFRYDMFRIRRIIHSLVIVFGYYHEKDELDVFLEGFDKWTKELNISPKSNTWIAPFQVFQVERNIDKLYANSYANLTSVVIWDILLDNGLQELCDMQPHNDIYPRDDEIYDLTYNSNASILDPYVNYKEDPTILDTLQLI